MSRWNSCRSDSNYSRSCCQAPRGLPSSRILNSVLPSRWPIAVAAPARLPMLSRWCLTTAGGPLVPSASARHVRRAGPGDFDVAFARIRQSRAEGVTFIPAPLFFTQRARIADLAIKHRLPLIAALPPQAEVGALLVYCNDWRQMYRQVAMYVDRILRGAKPSDLPVQDPTTFDLIINVKTAKAIGVTIPPSMLARANRVIE